MAHPGGTDSAGCVLVVDDEEDVRQLFGAQLRASGYEVFTADSAASARAVLCGEQGLGIDAVLLDLSMPHESGLDMLTQLSNTRIPVIIATASADPGHAVTALKNGAFDYLIKPVRVADLLLAVRNAVERGQMARELKARRALDAQGPLLFGDSVFASPAMRAIVTVVDQVKDSHVPVMIVGESGTGKEVVARMLHARSARHQGPFVGVNCVPSSTLEAELFGGPGMNGALERADGGTLFLDEVGELPSPLQAGLLRTLQERQLPGSARHLDARVVVSSSRDLSDEVRAGRFRSDLFYRLEVVSLRLPPLRERLDDIAPLAAKMLERFAREERRDVVELGADAIGTLRAYHWPGNVRELENVMKRSALVCSGRTMAASQLVWTHADQVPRTLPLDTTPPPQGTASGEVRKLRDYEAELMLRALAETRGNVSEAARKLGIGRATFYRRAQRYGLDI